MERLLSEVKEIVQKHNIEQENKEFRGELFNVFKAINLSSSEAAHSAFIRELLDPRGSHGLRSAPLQAFIRIVGDVMYPKVFPFISDNARVWGEYHIGRISDDYRQGGRLDIIIESEGDAIIIENKIDSGDRFKQLVRYYNYAESKFKGNYSLLYLTKNGHEASPASTNDEETSLKESEEYYVISYQTHIIKWLDECIHLAVEKPLVRETLIQYRNLVIDITDTMNTSELIPLLKEKKNIVLVKEIFNNISALYADIIKNDLPIVHESIAKELGLNYDSRNCVEGNGFVYFYKKDWKHAAIGVGRGGREAKSYISIRGRDGDLNPGGTPYVLSSLGNNVARQYPFGWKYLPYEILYLESINTAAAIITGSYKKELQHLIQDILTDVEKNLPQIAEMGLI